MKIGIDVQTALGQKTGFGFYVQNLVKNLKSIDRKNQYYLFRPQSEKDLSAPQRFLWDQWAFPRLAKEKSVNILHQTCFSAPIFYRGKVVVTVHDLIARLYGSDIPLYSRQYFGKWMPFSYKFADKIIAISENTKKDIIDLLKISPQKIRVIHLAAGEEFRPVKNKKKIAIVKEKYKTGERYLLHVGTLNPRKNLEFLIKVFGQIVLDFPEYNLVVTGKRGWYYEGLFKLVNDLNLKDKVIFTGYVEDQDSPYLYNGAALFLFPSLYEGFGLPPLEAMNCGVPVISSNTSSMPEVIGQAGILLSPKDQESWVGAIKKVLSDSILRKTMIKQGLVQAKNFSWEKCARETLKIYEEAAG